jgi:hypothetical protein
MILLAGWFIPGILTIMGAVLFFLVAKVIANSMSLRSSRTDCVHRSDL